ncbi:radical SAM protein [Geobacter sp. DSM 9736]|uniref:B12-binding domain-containing radical SAM protein n=1 Tax=Geobacter sp. DSM 9736 TaxID=1277350 RepID=UPI000B5133DC|nr:radical SAM protein [Geobacter sp. DSM 9736]SNB47656.1 Radical SAM superfamily enzyme YgiQ, UPF0313 family [Geobacter sp. DSM 9736]
MKVLLISIHAAPSPQAVPLAGAFLKAALMADQELTESVSVHLQEFFITDQPDACMAQILDEAPDAVGFSLYSWNRSLSVKLIKMLRRTRPEIVLFAGGPEATTDSERLLAEAPLDFVICGEGEVPFVASMARLRAGSSPAGIKGIACGKDGTAVTGETADPALLDTLPSPFLTGALDVDKYRGVLWQLSRGCDFSCDFCFDHRGKKGARRFPLERVAAELRLFVEKRVSQVFVLDSTFNTDVNRAKEILQLISATAPHIHFHFEVRSELLDAEMARLFAGITCSLQIGLQSADPQVHRLVHRTFNRDLFTEKVRLLNEAGAIFGFDLIYGLPGDTLEGFEKSLDYALWLRPNHLDIFPLAVLPGTELARNSQRFGMEYPDCPPYILEKSATFPTEAMSEAAALAKACDIFYSRGRAVAWFASVLAPLGRSPSAFLRDFYRATGEGKEVTEADLDDQQIWIGQREFISWSYHESGIDRLLPVALDLIDYHYHYAEALLAPPPELPTDRQLEHTDLLRHPLALAPSTRLARFHFEIFDLLEAGDIALEEFADCFSPLGSCAAIYPRAGEVFTESLDDGYFTLLRLLNGTTPAANLIDEAGLGKAEAAEFLEFAAAEGIIILT